LEPTELVYESDLDRERKKKRITDHSKLLFSTQLPGRVPNKNKLLEIYK
jgi:hypothetical protein